MKKIVIALLLLVPIMAFADGFQYIDTIGASWENNVTFGSGFAVYGYLITSTGAGTVDSLYFACYAITGGANDSLSMAIYKRSDSLFVDSTAHAYLAPSTTHTLKGLPTLLGGTITDATDYVVCIKGIENGGNIMVGWSEVAGETTWTYNDNYGAWGSKFTPLGHNYGEDVSGVRVAYSTGGGGSWNIDQAVSFADTADTSVIVTDDFTLTLATVDRLIRKWGYTVDMAETPDTILAPSDPVNDTIYCNEHDSLWIQYIAEDDDSSKADTSEVLVVQTFYTITHSLSILNVKNHSFRVRDDYTANTVTKIVLLRDSDSDISGALRVDSVTASITDPDTLDGDPEDTLQMATDYWAWIEITDAEMGVDTSETQQATTGSFSVELDSVYNDKVIEDDSVGVIWTTAATNGDSIYFAFSILACPDSETIQLKIPFVKDITDTTGILWTNNPVEPYWLYVSAWIRYAGEWSYRFEDSIYFDNSIAITDVAVVDTGSSSFVIQTTITGLTGTADSVHTYWALDIDSVSGFEADVCRDTIENKASPCTTTVTGCDPESKYYFIQIVYDGDLADTSEVDSITTTASGGGCDCAEMEVYLDAQKAVILAAIIAAQDSVNQYLVDSIEALNLFWGDSLATLAITHFDSLCALLGAKPDTNDLISSNDTVNALACGGYIDTVDYADTLGKGGGTVNLGDTLLYTIHKLDSLIARADSIHDEIGRRGIYASLHDKMGPLGDSSASSSLFSLAENISQMYDSINAISGGSCNLGDSIEHLWIQIDSIHDEIGRRGIYSSLHEKLGPLGSTASHSTLNALSEFLYEMNLLLVDIEDDSSGGGGSCDFGDSLNYICDKLDSLIVRADSIHDEIGRDAVTDIQTKLGGFLGGAGADVFTLLDTNYTHIDAILDTMLIYRDSTITAMASVAGGLTVDDSTWIYDFLVDIEDDSSGGGGACAGTGSESCSLVVNDTSGTHMYRAGIEIKTLDQTTQVIYPQFTDINGLKILSLDPDSYFVVIKKQDYDYYYDTLVVTKDSSWTLELTPMTRTLCTVSGYAMDGAGNYLRGALVTADIPREYWPIRSGTDAVFAHKETRSDANGKWELSLWPNDVLLTAQSDSSSVWRIIGKYGTAVLFDKHVTVPDSSTWTFTY